jgi:CheY-like chemotaxis protein
MTAERQSRCSTAGPASVRTRWSGSSINSIAAEKGAQKAEGTGMGLAIAKAIVDRASGKDPRGKPRRRRGRDHHKTAMNTSTILVVDDEPQLRRAMKATLTDLGYSVIESKSGEEALEALRHDTPDLILLDLNMPGIGGLEPAARSARRRTCRSSCSRCAIRSATRCRFSTRARTITSPNRSEFRSCLRASAQRSGAYHRQGTQPSA